ncbi:MAG: exodeoxyribonuclease VII large subunit [Bacteroidales bacterium]|nr:exodeoxyribonuclease VII large subunit [Bacteroidales bacterium]
MAYRTKAQSGEKNPLSLHELTQRIAGVVNNSFADPIWVVAELSDVHVAANGHCYMTLIEKEPKRGVTLASVRGMIWANRWWLLRDGFLEQTGQQFASGLKVMILVQVTMHELYGLGLNILDVDPTYTLGELARRRREILKQLTDDGVINMNRELQFPLLPRRIAIISAEGAAGYGDFVKQLSANTEGLKFYCHLFPATMQGQQTEPSVIAALERIYEVHEYFDVVVIIRGGGATVDLASFDSYLLAFNIAQFPLPIIVGIGHDRDETVLDHVAHTSVKTPTAAAALLIDAMAGQMQKVLDLQEEIKDNLKQIMDDEHQRLQYMGNAVRNTHVTLTQQISRLDMKGQNIRMLILQRMQRENDKLEFFEKTIQMAQPDNILKRGFSITRLNGHAVKSAASVPQGSLLKIQTAEGEISALSSAP